MLGRLRKAEYHIAWNSQWEASLPELGDLWEQWAGSENPGGTSHVIIPLLHCTPPPLLPPLPSCLSPALPVLCPMTSQGAAR